MAKRGYKLQEFVAHASAVNCLNVGKKTCRLFVTGGEDRKVNLWAFGKENSLLSLSGHTSSVESVTFDSTEVLVLAGSSNGTIKLWDLEAAKIVRTLTGHRSSCTSVQFHPFGEFFASGSLDTDLKIWDIRKKGCIQTYKGHTRRIGATRFTPDGRWVVTGGEDNTVKLWDLTAGKLLHDFKFHTGQIRCIDFHPHEFLLATGSSDRTVKFWDLETFELTGSAGPEATGVRSTVFHPDGRTIFCGLEETLKVFSWEPIRCHDVVDMGWSTLGDLSITHGKLLGCSYYQNCVGVWVADVSLIGPYGVGVLPKTNGLMEPLYAVGENHSFELQGSTEKSIATVAVEIDSGNKIEDKMGSLSMCSDDCDQSDLQGIASSYGSNVMPINSGFGRNGAKSSCQIAPPKLDSKFSSKASTITSGTVKTGKTKESFSDALSLSSRKKSTCPSTFHAHSLLPLKKDSFIEVRAFTNVKANMKPVSMSVIVPREIAGLETATSCRKDKAITDKSHGLELCIPFLMQRTSFPTGNIHNQSTEATDRSLSEATGGFEEKYKRIMSLEQPVVSGNNECAADLVSSCGETSPVKYIKGVAVQIGKTRSLVESWERRDRCNSGYSASISPSSDPVNKADGLPSLLKGRDQTPAKDFATADVDFVPEILSQDHDAFTNAARSRLMKLQMVRHFWEQNGVKGAINAIGKLPDHSVQVDVIGVLIDKIEIFTLELFSCLLPVLSGLLHVKTDRHIIVSLEMLLELVKIFGPVIRSTISASSLIRVDLQAEQRLTHCNQCLKLLEKIKQILPLLIRKGGFLAKYAQELRLALHDV